jgi:hypothetical protein
MIWMNAKEANHEPHFLKRPDYYCAAVEIPRMQESSMHTALSYMIRSQFPGSPSNTEIDFVLNKRRRASLKMDSLIVFAIERDKLDRAKNVDPNGQILSSTLLLKSIVGSSEGFGVFMAEDWAELAYFGGGALVWSRAVCREGDMSDTIELLLGDTTWQLPRQIVVLSPSGDGIRDEFQSVFSNHGPVSLSIRECPKRVERKLLSEIAFFHSKTVSEKARVRLHRIMLLASILSAIAALNIYASRLERAVSAAKLENVEIDALEARKQQTRKKLEALESEYAASQKASSPEAYKLIAELVRLLGPGAKIMSLRVEGKQFLVECDGIDALPALSRMEGAIGMRLVHLAQSIPSPYRGERFTIAGEWSYD